MISRHDKVTLNGKEGYGYNVVSRVGVEGMIWAPAGRKSAAAPPLAMISSARSNGAILCDDCAAWAIINEQLRCSVLFFFRLSSLQSFELIPPTHPWSANLCREMRIGRISASSTVFQDLGYLS